MKKVIKIKYDPENKKAFIYYENEFVDSSVIEGKEISQWVYPFIIKNKRWNGIYEEMKELCQSDEFIVIFIGNDSDFEVLYDALKDTKAELLKVDNKVVILYNDEDNSVNITINDKEFDTSRIDNTAIDEWVMPFETEETKWKGIYSEIVSYLGINSYSVQFIGNQKHMNLLMDNCPENVDITFKPFIAEESVAVAEKKAGKNDSFNSLANKTAGGNNMFAAKSNAKGMSSLNNTAQKNSVKGMSSLNSGSVKNTVKGMSSLNSGSASKGTVNGMSKNTAQKNSAKNISSSNGGSSSKNSDNLMSSIKNTPSARNNINPEESKLSVPEEGWEDTSTGLIKELKTELKNLREYNSMLSLVGLVLCIVSAAGILLSVLLMSSVVAIISAIPALVFAVWAFIEDYKKIAVTVIILDVLLAVIVCLIVFIRWRLLWNSFAWKFW